MKKIVVFAITFIFFCSVYSQNRIYLRPLSYTKKYNSELAGYISPPYFQYTPIKAGWLYDVEIGIMGGYLFNKGRTYIEAGIESFSSESGWTLDFLRYYPTSSTGGIYYSNQIISEGGTSGRSFPLLIATQIAKWEPLKIYNSISIRCNLILGINFYRQNLSKYPISVISFDNILLSPTIRMDITGYTYAMQPKSTIYNLGFSFDFFLKEKNMFNLMITYVKGFRTLSSESVDITITNMLSNTSEKYSYHSYGNGSGIMIQLARRFNLPTIRHQSKIGTVAPGNI